MLVVGSKAGSCLTESFSSVNWMNQQRSCSSTRWRLLLRYSLGSVIILDDRDMGKFSGIISFMTRVMSTCVVALAQVNKPIQFK